MGPRVAADGPLGRPRPVARDHDRALRLGRTGGRRRAGAALRRRPVLSLGALPGRDRPPYDHAFRSRGSRHPGCGCARTRATCSPPSCSTRSRTCWYGGETKSRYGACQSWPCGAEGLRTAASLPGFSGGPLSAWSPRRQTADARCPESEQPPAASPGCYAHATPAAAGAPGTQPTSHNGSWSPSERPG